MPTLKDITIEVLKNISPSASLEEIMYTKSLVKGTKSGKTQALLQFAGSLDPRDVQEITTAIDAGCENIDKNEW